MQDLSNRIIILLIITYIITQFYSPPVLYIVTVILTTLVMLLSMIFSRVLPRIFSGIMIGIGIIIMYVQKAGFEVWAESITKNLPLVCLIIVVPILTIPIEIGKYDDSITQFASKLNGKPQLLYIFLSSTFYILGPITNLGSIHIIHSIVKIMNLPVEFLGRLYIRGFSSINTWSPYFASVFLVVYYLNIPMLYFLPFGLLLSFFQFWTANIVFSFKEKQSINFGAIESKANIRKKKLYELLFFLLLLSGTIFILEVESAINVSVIIIITAIVYSFIWGKYLKEFRRFIKEVNLFQKKIIPSQANEVSLFLSAGFFGVVLSKTVISDIFSDLWTQISHLSILLLILFTIALVGLLSFVGIHQIVVITSILSSVSPTNVGLHDITFAMILLSSWAVAGTVSPITPTNVVTSNILKVDVYQIILKWNLLYTVLISCVHTMVIYCVHLLL
ncbi:hypothetical protein [Fredinandcohnia sp. FSL W7-1320]|uniref:hypothetical protein n=1 Tax=Fredinandcohnia sp. FSL W7-1320 TaxID=2954540 RepID=UPI0030FDBA0C